MHSIDKFNKKYIIDPIAITIKMITDIVDMMFSHWLKIPNKKSKKQRPTKFDFESNHDIFRHNLIPWVTPILDYLYVDIYKSTPDLSDLGLESSIYKAR